MRGVLPPVLVNNHAVMLNSETTIRFLQNGYVRCKSKNIYLLFVGNKKFVVCVKKKRFVTLCNVLGQTKVKTNELRRISKNAMRTRIQLLKIAFMTPIGGLFGYKDKSN